MSRLWSGWHAALRVARREARRSKGRSTLVIAMIGLPVAALAFAAVTVDMFTLRPMEKLERMAGAADAVVIQAADGPVHQEPDRLIWARDNGEEPPPADLDAAAARDAVRAALPPGSRIVPDVTFAVQVDTATGVGEIEGRALDLTNPITRGMAVLRGGRAPHGPGEVALSRQAVTRTGAGVGGTLRLPDGQRYRVVGVVEFPDRLRELALFDPAHPPSGKAVSNAGERLLVDTPAPLRWSDVKRLNQRGVVALSRDVVRHPPAASEVVPVVQGGSVTTENVSLGALVVGMAVLEIVLLAGPAFAVGARRRQRDLALLAANGATPAHLRRVVLADGVVLGGAGAIAGIVVGIAVAFAARWPVEEYLAHSRAGGYRVFPLALAGIAAFAVTTALLAATVPAFVAARQDVVAALAGRRGATRSRKRWLVLGTVLAASGAALGDLGAWRVSTPLILAGLVVAEFGLVLCTPALVGLVARMARILPLSARIALRDTARNRAAAAPAISAVMAAVAGSVALATYQGGVDLQQRGQYEPSLPHGYASVRFDDPSGDAATSSPPVGAAAELLRTSLATREVVPVVGAECRPAESEAACEPRLSMPTARRCPYLDQDEARQLTIAEQRAAAHDPRCRTKASWSYGVVDVPFVVDDGTRLATLTGASGDELHRAVETLRAGGVVVFDHRYVDNDEVTIELAIHPLAGAVPGPPALRTSVRARGYALDGGTATAQAIISPTIARQTGLEQQVKGLVAATVHVPTQAERDRLAAGLHRLDGHYAWSVEDGPAKGSGLIMTVLSVAAAVIALGAAGIATGLAAADSRPDLATLAAVGASPGVRRRLSLSQSGVIAGLGSVLGAGAGLGAAVAVLAALNHRYADTWPAPPPYPITVPWLNLTVALLVVPAIAMLGAGLLTRSRLPVERRL
ncbi:FtsX-like permease family protein [Planosporangium thailandense]|uniref:FtsX-like permease family protein n=1 Tax=Planosporangium thailandense TaxID=765197 RepID=A0ABX0XQJ3_9ACTN|nr:FtsX-like permease family protein [Planosporangium thailandense]NJC68241.1 FtsX-like permease family protein [Planosporangium thailandense]